jgi:protein-tyrosine phosphatase
MLTAVLCGLTWLAAGVDAGAAEHFRAGTDSLRYRLDVGKDEQRGPAAPRTPSQVKERLKPLLEELRRDGKGLKEETERNIESFFIVADAFEADGRLASAADVLLNLQDNLEALRAARQGKARPGSLVASEADLLAYRDVHNVHAVTPSYLAGGQPSEKGYRWLKAKGVTTVINLRQSSAHEKEMVERLGLRYVQVSWPDRQPPTMQQVRRIVDVIEADSKRGGKVFQHCLRGIGRDGTMVCCVRVASGTSAEKAIAEWLKAAPTWLEDQARDKEGKPVQLERIKEFERELRSKKKTSRNP